MTITTPAPTAEESNRKKAAWRPLAAAAAAGSVLLVAGFGVWAWLSAEATGVQSVNTGTLRLSLADVGTTGFSQTVSNMGAGDTQSRYVTLTNGGTLEGRLLTMAVAATGDSVLIDDTADTAALRVSVANCAEQWAGGICGPGATSLLSNVVLSALSAPNALAGIATLEGGAALNLKVTVPLPEQDELYRDGVLTDSGAASVQDAAATLNYTFAETQREATDT